MPVSSLPADACPARSAESAFAAHRPIGVFDSGVGGLSVLRSIREELAGEDLLYIADTAHAPYGDKPMAVIESRALWVSERLLAQGAKALVIACNTATGAAVQVLRGRYPDLPIIAMEPAVKPAVERTRTGVVGVLATSQTLASAKFRDLLARVGGGARVLPQACPGLVERVEAGDLDGEGTRDLLARYLGPLLEAGADTLVLGCTHYPHLAPLIGELVGPGVTLLDSGGAVARQVRRRLAAAGLLRGLCGSHGVADPDSAASSRIARGPGAERFWTSGPPEASRTLIRRLWGAEAWVAGLPEAPSPGGQLVLSRD